MGKCFSVPFRKYCEVCGVKLSHRFRRYCSRRCRQKAINKRWRGYQNRWQNERWTARIEKLPPDKRIQCQHCGRWYRQIGSHAVQRHGYASARAYREEFGFDVKRGQLPKDLVELKARLVFENKTVNNLKKGRRFWYVVGDKKAGHYKRSLQTIERLKNLCKNR